MNKPALKHSQLDPNIQEHIDEIWIDLPNPWSTTSLEDQTIPPVDSICWSINKLVNDFVLQLILTVVNVLDDTSKPIPTVQTYYNSSTDLCFDNLSNSPQWSLFLCHISPTSYHCCIIDKPRLQENIHWEIDMCVVDLTPLLHVPLFFQPEAIIGFLVWLG